MVCSSAYAMRCSSQSHGDNGARAICSGLSVGCPILALAVWSSFSALNKVKFRRKRQPANSMLLVPADLIEGSGLGNDNNEYNDGGFVLYI